MAKSTPTKCIAYCMAITMTVLSPIAARAGLEQTMERAFNQEINITPAGAYMGARRGVVEFGRVRVANKVSNVQLVTIVPPKLSVGCGGIDMFGGSLSFISGAQIVKLAKDIVTGAVQGYLFDLAMSNFPDGKDALAKMRSAIQWANQQSINSCQASQALKNYMEGKTDNLNSKAAVMSSGSGSTSDIFQATFSGSAISKVSAQALKDDAGFKPNPIWSAILDSGAYSWFPLGDRSFAEAMLSLTGAVILEKNSSNVDSNGDEFLKPKFQPATLTIDDLVAGGTVSVLSCNNDDCDSPSTRTITLTGFHQRYFDALSKTGGIIDKFYQGSSSFTTTEQQLLQNMKPNIGWAVGELSKNPGAAREFASVMSKAAAYNTACDLGREMFSVMEGNLRSVGEQAAIAQIEARKANLREACATATGEIANTQALFAMQKRLMEIIKEKG